MPQIGDFSHHATVRMQQRGIRPEVLDVLLSYGRHSHVQRGRTIVYMDGRARRKAIRECGREAGPLIDRLGRIVAVVGDDGVVVTVCYRDRRIPRD